MVFLVASARVAAPSVDKFRSVLTSELRVLCLLKCVV